MKLARIVVAIVLLALLATPVFAQTVGTEVTGADRAKALRALENICPNHWAYPAVRFLVEQGVIVGRLQGDGSFDLALDQPVTRAELIMALSRAVMAEQKANRALAAVDRMQSEINLLRDQWLGTPEEIQALQAKLGALSAKMTDVGNTTPTELMTWVEQINEIDKFIKALKADIQNDPRWSQAKEQLDRAEKALDQLSDKIRRMQDSFGKITDADRDLAERWEQLYEQGQLNEEEHKQYQTILVSIRARIEALEKRVTNLELRVENLENRPSQPVIVGKHRDKTLEYVLGVGLLAWAISESGGDVNQSVIVNPPVQPPQEPPYGKPCPYWCDHVAELAHQGFITDEYDSRWYFRGWSWYDVDQQLQNHLLTCPYALQSGSYTGNPEQPWDPQDGGPSIGDAIVQKGDIKLSLTNLTLPRLTFGPLSVIIGGDRLEAVGISLGNFTFTQSRTGYLLGFDDQKTIKLLVGQGFLSLRTQPTKSTSVGLSIIGGRPEGRLMATARF